MVACWKNLIHDIVVEYEQLLTGPRGAVLQNKTESTGSFETSGISPAWSQILKDLVQEFGLEGFDPVVRNVATMISKGTFVNVREVKLKLKYDGRV